MIVSVERVLKASGAPEKYVRANWPLVYAAMDKHQVASELSQCGMIATITVECPPWKPISEWGEHPEYDTGRKAKRLGNTPEKDGDGQKYEGRGFIQLTGRANYEGFGLHLGIDLLRDPDAALEPHIAAEIATLYWKWKRCYKAAEAQEWQKVRKLVNGGLHGWQRFYDVLQKLGVVP